MTLNNPQNKSDCFVVNNLSSPVAFKDEYSDAFQSLETSVGSNRKIDFEPPLRLFSDHESKIGICLSCRNSDKASPCFSGKVMQSLILRFI